MKKITKDRIKNQLSLFAEDFLLENYGIGLNIPIELNGRLITTLGRFIMHDYGNSKESIRIELSTKMIEHNEMDFVENVLKHELIHYALFETGYSYRDGDDDFEFELKEHGVYSTGEPNAMVKQHVYTCECKDVEFHQNRKDGHNYRCRECRTRLRFHKTIEPLKLVKIVK